MAVATNVGGGFGSCPIGQVASTAATRISVSKTNGNQATDSAVRSITAGLRLAYPVECNISDV